MQKTTKKFLIAGIVIAFLWIAFTQFPNYLDRDILNGKAAVLRSVANAESVEFQNLRKVEHEGLTIVCGEYNVKDTQGEYVGYKGFSAKVVDKNSVFSDDPQEYQQFCAASA